MRRFMFVGMILLGACVLRSNAAEPNRGLTLGAPFADHAVLQREMQVPVWGWSAPGAKVTVEFGKQKKQATAGAAGKWMLMLDPLKASFAPAQMVVRDNKGNALTIDDLLVGEVWLASGQSNMQWPVSKTTSKELAVPARDDGVVPIREFQVSSVTSQLHPIEKASGAWKAGNYGDYSAIAYAFAHKLYEELDVPIGILNGSFSETSIQAWVPRIGFRDGQDAYTQTIWQRLQETDPSTPAHKTAWTRYYQELEDGLAANEARIARGEPALEVSGNRPGNLRGNRDASWMFNGRINPLVPYALRGAIWNQGYANMGEGIVYYNNLHSLIRGWRLVWNQPDLPVYFHQFYTTGSHTHPAVGGVAEMRLGTLMARDIPHTGMASQIDIGGAIHYSQKAIPGQRLALHALKNQYGRDIVTDGPIFKSYEVKGNKVVVSFDHVKGGLVVAQMATSDLGGPAVIENGADQVNLFYLAGADRVWHPAQVQIDGDTVILMSTAVTEPRGVSYGTGGIGFVPNLYNQALLPMSPFMYYDQEVVLASNWPELPLKIANYEPTVDQHGREYEYRRMPLLSTQFRDNAVLQAGVPVTVFGGAGVDSWRAAHEEGTITFRFGPENGTPSDRIQHEIPVTVGMEEWEIALPVFKAGTAPYALDVTFTVDGEVVQERRMRGIVFGDVYYVAAPTGRFTVANVASSGQIVRVMERNAKRDRHGDESRFSIAVSTQPDNRFASEWVDAGDTGIAAAIGHGIAAKARHPVGIIFMQNNSENIRLSSWIPAADLKHAPSLLQDYLIVSARYPWGPGYVDSVRQYIADYKMFWGDYIPRMIATKTAPDGSNWGAIIARRSTVEGQSDASQTWNVMGASFAPGSFKGLIFLTGSTHVAGDGVKSFDSELAVLANSWKSYFGGEAVPFVYAMPDEALAAGIAKPDGIRGPSKAVPISDWNITAEVIGKIVQALD